MYVNISNYEHNENMDDYNNMNSIESQTINYIIHIII